MFIKAKLCTYSRPFILTHTIQEKEHHNKQQNLKDKTMSTSCSRSHLDRSQMMFVRRALQTSHNWPPKPQLKPYRSLRQIPWLKSLSERGHITHDNRHSASHQLTLELRQREMCCAVLWSALRGEESQARDSKGPNDHLAFIFTQEMRFMCFEAKVFELNHHQPQRAKCSTFSCRWWNSSVKLEEYKPV